MTRRIREDHCHRCHLPLLTGFDSDTAGLFIRLEVAPINAGYEAWALLDGWDTFHITGAGIVNRSHWHIAANSVEQLHVEHRCGHSVPEAWQIPPPPAPPAPADPTIVPF